MSQQQRLTTAAIQRTAVAERAAAADRLALGLAGYGEGRIFRRN